VADHDRLLPSLDVTTFGVALLHHHDTANDLPHEEETATGGHVRPQEMICSEGIPVTTETAILRDVHRLLATGSVVRCR